jgi:hypothetical protein
MLRFRPGIAVSRHLIFAAALGAVSVTPLFAQATATPPAPQPQALAKPANLPAARAVIDKHIEAIGGRKAIMGHKSSKAVGTLSIPANGMTGTIEAFAAAPNKLVARITLPGIGEIQEGFNGTVGWSLNPMTGPSLTDGKQLEEKKFDSDFYGDLKDESRYSSMKTVEKTMFDGRECYKVSLVRKGGTEDFEYYDVATGLRAGQSGERESPMGTLQVQNIFADYKKFGDLMHPTTVKQSAMGVEQIFTFTSVEYDKVDPAVFEIPAQIKALIK